MPSAQYNSFLFAEPTGNYLEYGSTVLHALVTANKLEGQTVTEIEGANATVTNVKNALNTQNPVCFTMVGHGSYTTTTLYNTEVFMQSDAEAGTEPKENIKLMAGRCVHLNSCQTGKYLGTAIRQAGALAYLGSNENFYFHAGTNTQPNTTRETKTAFLAEYAFDVALLQGKTIVEARSAQIKAYDDEIAYWATGAGSNNPLAGELADMLLLNKSVSTFAYGQDMKPSPIGGYAPRFTLSASSMVVAIPLLILGALYFWLKS